MVKVDDGSIKQAIMKTDLRKKKAQADEDVLISEFKA